MKYAVEMGSDAYISSFVNIGFRHSKVFRGIHARARTFRQQGGIISVLLFIYSFSK
jgi:hypothetical protein